MDYDDWLEIKNETKYKEHDHLERDEALQDEYRELMIEQGERNA